MTGTEVPLHRSYHARKGRLSPAKRRALDELTVRWALAPGERPTVVDLGCGTGETALHLARSRPDDLVVAVDVHSASVATLLRQVEAVGPANLRVEWGDGAELLRHRVEPASLTLLAVLFPDPWPKRRHRHRRLVQASFAGLAADRLADGGVLALATDRDDYASQMIAVLDAEAGLAGGPARRGRRPVTFYEARAAAAGRPVHELRYVRRARTAGSGGPAAQR